jgi:hypothetical protein
MFACNHVHMKCRTFVWKVFLISLYFKHFNNFNWKCILTAHMHKCNRICHYYIPSLETSLLMAMLRSKYIGGLVVKWQMMVCFLTPCHRATRKLVNALPCVVDRSRVSSFSYAKSCTCVCQVVLHTYRFKVIDSLMQDVGSQVTNRPVLTPYF